MKPIWQRIPVPVRGINRAVTEPEMDPRQGISPWQENLLPIDGELEARSTDGATAISRDLRELFEFGDETGTQHLVAIGEDKKLYDINDTGGALAETEIGTLTGDSYSASLVTLGGSGLNRVYISLGHRTDPISTQTNLYNWNGTNFAQIAGTGFSRLDGSVLLAYKGHLLMADTIERIDPNANEFYPYRIRWAHILDPTEWSIDDTNTAGFVDLVEDKNNSRILTMVPIREVVAVYKADCIYNMTYKGILQFTAQITATDRGVLGPKAVAPVLDGNKHLVVSQDNIYLYNGFGFDEPAVGDPIRDWFYDELDWSRKEQVRVTAHPGLYEAWINFPVKGGSTKTVVWNWKYSGWFPQTMDYNCLYLANLFFDEPTFFGTRGDSPGLFKVREGRGVVETVYDIPLQRREDQQWGTSLKWRIHQATIDADGLFDGEARWSAKMRSTNNLSPTDNAYIDEDVTVSTLRLEKGLRTLEFGNSKDYKYNALRLTSPAQAEIAEGKDHPRLREVTLAFTTKGRL